MKINFYDKYLIKNMKKDKFSNKKLSFIVNKYIVI